jgi:ABC-type Fe3+/spermidine/putrescine transport system ATPase subunit
MVCNVGLGLVLRGAGKTEREARVRPVLEQLKIAHLADEPFAALDQPNRRRLVRELGRLLRARQLVTVFVTHDLAEATALCDRCAISDTGAILQHEPPRELFARSRTLRVAEILGLTI